MTNSTTPARNDQQKNHIRPAHAKVSDRSQFYKIKLVCGTDIPLAELEACGISYVPCTHDTPIFKYAQFWDVHLQVNLNSYQDQAHGWNMSNMQGVQIMTGRPTYRPDSPNYQHLVLLDIEARFFERYPDAATTFENLVRSNCESTPCIISSKGGGKHYYFFSSYLAPKIEFHDKTDNKMLVEIFSRKGLGRLDDRYRMIEGSILNIPLLPKETLQQIYQLLTSIAAENQHTNPNDAQVVERSQLGDLDILWTAEGKSQYFPAVYCQATPHREQHRKTVQFFKRDSGVLGRCYNCGESWWEEEPHTRNTLTPHITEEPIDNMTSKESNEYSHTLFEQLRATRKELADAEHVPLYFVFSNKTLQKMATQLPQTVEAFRQISGVGPVKVKKYADVFLPIIRAYCQEHGLMDENRLKEEEEKENQTYLPDSHTTKPMKLYEVHDEIEATLFMPEEETFDSSRFEELNLSFDEKVDSCAAVMKNLKAQAAELDAQCEILYEEIRELRQKKQALENNRKGLAEYVKRLMESLGLKKAGNMLHRVTIAQSPLTVEVDIEKLDPKWIKEHVSTYPDKRGIIDHIKETGEIPDGVKPIQNTHLRVS